MGLCSLLLSVGLLASLARSQQPAWPQAPARTVRVLDGSWQFAWLGASQAAVEELSPAGLPTPHRMTVPGAFDLSQLVAPGAGGAPAGVNLAGKHGTALYRRTFPATPHAYLRVFLGGCGFWCSVWLDGVRLGEKGGDSYSPAWFGGAAPSPAAFRTLEVIVDNRFNHTRAPLMAYVDDWYLYGGLFRSVEVHELPALALLRADVLVRNASAGALALRVHLHDLTETTRWVPRDIEAGWAARLAPRYPGAGPASLPRLPPAVNLTIQFDADAPGGARGPPLQVTLQLDAQGTGVVEGLLVPQPALWAPTAPALHTVAVRVGWEEGSGDTLLERFGLRSVSVCSAAGAGGPPVVCLNGLPVKLLGYGRHDTGPQEGHALSDFARLRDLQLIAGLGGNFARLGHYTQHPNVAALADELGVLNGVEVIGWDAAPGTYQDALWLGAGLASLEASVNASFNHPSSIMYAYINEGVSDNASLCGAWAAFDARYKSLQVQGLTTYANDKGTADACFAPSGADVLGFNLYPGWYSEAPGSDASVGWDRAAQLAYVPAALDALAAWMGAQHPGKAFMVSELGAGALPGWVDEAGGYWSQSYQARVLSAGATRAVGDARWSGIALWQLFDQRVYTGTGALGRPRSFNNKGTFNENRKPKEPAWAAVQAAFAGRPPPDFLEAELLPG